MGLGWDSVLKMAAVGAFVMLALSTVLFFIFQNIGYDSYLLSIILIISILAFIVLRIIWSAKKFLF
jgi:hypothetical protein